MDNDITDSLEAIADLLYLIGKSAHDTSAVSMYVRLAEDTVRLIAIECGLDSSQSVFSFTPQAPTADAPVMPTRLSDTGSA